MKSPVLPSRELLERYNRPGPRYTSYPPVPFWSTEFAEQEYRAVLAEVAATPEDTLSLYVHLPFCAERCAYCGCNATVTRHAHVVDRYLDRVERELALIAPLLGGKRKVVQMHWGGGTPNFLSAAQTRRLFGLLDGAFAIDRSAEIALEMDPRIGTYEQLVMLRELGFNRVSFGVQDIHPMVQTAIGRIQPIEQTESLYRWARDLGFASINLDLVYGLPFQTPEVFAATLRAITELRPDRVACFSYAHLPQSRPNQKRVDASGLPEPHVKAGLFHQALAAFAESGYSWIGMDHFALADDELAVAADERKLHRNFMGYTTRPTPHQLALGASAISDLGGTYVQNDAALGRYQRVIDDGRLPVVRGHRMSDDDRLRRLAITHLMCNLELPYNLGRAEFGTPVGETLADEIVRVQAFAEEGFVELLPDRLQVSELGRFFIRNLAMELDAYQKPGPARPLFSSTV
ncbi:MAG: oxygen-independent coproporphyrinogen III oxidase [Oscillochloris sp.]|nr:oxygen-independent coproporphyrinogen III oxidase [Oscillochloris sp.]